MKITLGGVMMFFLLLFHSELSASRALGFDEPKLELDEVCGSLGHVVGNVKAPINSSRDPKTKPLAHIALSLYPHTSDADCCQGHSLLETVTTRRGGDFRFKKHTPGRYWLAFFWQGQNYKAPIVISSIKSGADFCSATKFRADNAGNLTYSVTVTVD